MGTETWPNLPFTDAVVVNPPVALEKGKVYPFVDMASVNPTTRSVPETEHREFSGGGSRFMPGDTLMARITPCLENGKIARFQPSDGSSAGFGSTEFIVIRGREGVTENEFAYYLTKWDEFRQFAVSQMTGTSGRQRVPAESLAHFTVAVPPLSIQRRIAAVLGALDDKIELNRKRCRTLEAMARAIFQSWFVDFDPVRAKAAVRREHPKWSDEQVSRAACPKLKPELAALFPDRFEDSPLGPIPAGWRVGTLGEVAENPRRGINADEIEPGTPYIALEHMPRRSIALAEWTSADAIESNKFAFQRGEILFGKLRPYFHKVGIAPVDGVCSTDILVIVPKQPEWFGFCVGHFSSDAIIQHADRASTGTKMPRTNWNDLARFEVAIPQLEVAKAFTKQFQPIIDRIHQAIGESRTLAALRDALLPKLISGELRVPDAERIVGRAL